VRLCIVFAVVGDSVCTCSPAYNKFFVVLMQSADSRHDYTKHTYLVGPILFTLHFTVPFSTFAFILRYCSPVLLSLKLRSYDTMDMLNC